MIPEPSTVHFEWSIRFGDLLTMGGAILVAFGIVFRRGKEETRSEEQIGRALNELTEMKQDIKTLTEKMSKVDTMNVQVSLLMKWYDELRRGVGFVQAHSSRKAVDDEY